MDHIVEWTVYIAVAALILAGVIGMVLAGIAFLSPRLRNMEKGIKPIKGAVPCCPPGMGCNDPDKSLRKCMRIEARRVALVEELMELDKAWVRFNTIPDGRKKQKLEAHRVYHEQRDKIFARAMNSIAETLNQKRQVAIPAHVSGGATSGEVLGSSENNDPSVY